MKQINFVKLRKDIEIFNKNRSKVKIGKEVEKNIIGSSMIIGVIFFSMSLFGFFIVAANKFQSLSITIFVSFFLLISIMIMIVSKIKENKSKHLLKKTGLLILSEIKQIKHDVIGRGGDGGKKHDRYFADYQYIINGKEYLVLEDLEEINVPQRLKDHFSFKGGIENSLHYEPRTDLEDVEGITRFRLVLYNPSDPTNNMIFPIEQFNFDIANLVLS